MKLRFVFFLFSILSCSAAHAQLTMYGWLDTGFFKASGSDLVMRENDNSAFGIKGVENIGNGYKVQFDLQRRFYTNTGGRNGTDWEGAANVGIRSPVFNLIRFGRLNEITTENVRIIDPFNQDGPGSMLRSSQRITRISNTFRWDSPKFYGTEINATYSLGENTRNPASGSATFYGADNDGYALSVRYINGPLILLSSWSRQADSNNSSLWNLGGLYRFGKLLWSVGYERTLDKGWAGGEKSGASLAQAYGGSQGIRSRQESLSTGLEYKAGPNTFNAMFSYARIKEGEVVGTPVHFNQESARKLSIGYVYNFSRRTYIYAIASHTNYGSPDLASFYRGTITPDASLTSYHIGMHHRF